MLISARHRPVNRKADSVLISDPFVQHQLAINSIFVQVKYRSIPCEGTIFGDGIVGIRQDADCALVTFAPGSPRAVDLVIGADSTRLSTRSCLAPGRILRCN